MKRFLIIFSLLFALSAVIISCSSSNEKTKTEPTTDMMQSETSSVHMPKFMALDIDGNFHSLDQYLGKPMILNFWGTWCPPCRRELPDLKKIYEEYGPQGLEIIGLAVNDTPDKVKEFAAKNGLNWVMLIANQESVSSYQIGTGVPVTIFLNKEGKEVARAIGARDYNYFKSEVEKII